jgi:hypothetical protein
MRVRREPFDLAHEVAQAAGVASHIETGATLIACEEGAKFLAECRDATVRVIGAEGFDLIDGNRRPDMQAILDLSDVDEGPASVEEAERFVAAVCRPGLYFEFDLARP